MPYTRIGAAKFSQHDVKSPLLSPETSCGTCHTDVDYVVDRVKLIQDSVWEAQTRAEEALVDAIEAIAKAEETTTHSTLLDEARKLHREAQLRWDFVASENSMGFHNSQEALRILTAATDLARQAQIMALKASNVQEISLIR
jgi:nitrite reductase (cytochrome c-552)